MSQENTKQMRPLILSGVWLLAVCYPQNYPWLVIELPIVECQTKHK